MQKSMVGEGLASSRNDMVMMRNGRRPSFAKATADRQAPPLQKCISLLVCISVFLFLCTPSALAASARQLPASYNESTYGDGTRDYTSLATWEAATDNNLVSAAKGEVLSCYSDNTPYDTASVIFSGATTNSSYFRVVRAASGEEHGGDPTAGVEFRGSPANTYGIFNLQENYLQIQDLRLNITDSGTVNYRYGIRVYDYGANSAVVACMITGSSKANQILSGIMNYHNRTGSGKFFAVNCIFYEINNIGSGAGYGFTGWSTGAGSSYCYNCTSVDNETAGFYRNNDTCIAKNCVSEDNGLAQWSGVWTKTTCTNNNGVVFADQTNDDYHLDSTDTVAIDQGTNLSADTNYAFDDDIDGDTRSGTWDIGADEYYVAPASSPPIVFKTGVRIGRNVLIKT